MKKHALHAPSPAMVVALFALFVALGGTGYAATNLGGRARSAKAAKKADGASDKKLVKQLAPSLSVAFAKRAVNAVNATSAGQATSASGLTALPSGATESGEFASAAEDNYLAAAITFQQPLSAPVVHWDATTSTSIDCPGAGSAAPGYLCLYVANSSNLFASSPYPSYYYLNSPAGAGKYGVTFYWAVNNPGTTAYVNGSWSYTAP